MKANNDNPSFSDSSSRKKTGRCVHAAIVAIYVYNRSKSGVGVGGGGEVELEADGEMGGMEEVRPEGGVRGGRRHHRWRQGVSVV